MIFVLQHLALIPLLFSHMLLASLPSTHAIGNALNEPFYILFFLVAVALLPFLAVILTSFTKIVVVLSIARQALGMPQTPPNIVIISLSMILTCFSMAPVFKDININTWEEISKTPNAESIRNAIQSLEVPLKTFLVKHSEEQDKQLFLNAIQNNNTNITEDSLIVLAPAFLISELSKAFQLGFLIYLPFLVIDMTVANLLMALGMQMLSPTAISLPFKLLLFVLVDGFRILSEGLVKG
jgi:type III secretion apparatus YscR/HrcR family protein